MKKDYNNLEKMCQKKSNTIALIMLIMFILMYALLFVIIIDMNKKAAKTAINGVTKAVFSDEAEFDFGDDTTFDFEDNTDTFDFDDDADAFDFDADTETFDFGTDTTSNSNDDTSTDDTMYDWGYNDEGYDGGNATFGDGFITDDVEPLVSTAHVVTTDWEGLVSETTIEAILDSYLGDLPIEERITSAMDVLKRDAGQTKEVTSFIEWDFVDNTEFKVTAFTSTGEEICSTSVSIVE